MPWYEACLAPVADGGSSVQQSDAEASESSSSSFQQADAESTEQAQMSLTSVVHSVTSADPAGGGRLALRSTDGFSEEGGWAVLSPGTAIAEPFCYRGVDHFSESLLEVERPFAMEHSTNAQVLEIPHPCDIIDCSIVNPPENPCTDGTLECGIKDPGPLVQEILAIIEAQCPALDCPNQVINEISEVIAQVCGPGLLLECLATVERAVAELVGRVCPNGVSTCADPTVGFLLGLVNGVLESLMRTVCPQTGSSPECVAETTNRVITVVNQSCTDDSDGEQGAIECANMLIELLMDRLESVCTGSGTGAQQCVGMISSALETGARILCPQTGNSPECVGEVTTRITTIVNESCTDDSYGEQGAIECANMLIELLMDRLESVCTGSGTATQQCVGMVNGALDTAVRIICPQTGNSPECVGELTTRVMTIVNQSCTDESYGEQGATECVNMVIEEIEDFLESVCTDSDVTSEGMDECVGMTFAIICPSAPSGATDMCYEEIRDRLLSSIPPPPNGTPTPTSLPSEIPTPAPAPSPFPLPSVTVRQVCEVLPEVCPSPVKDSVCPPSGLPSYEASRLPRVIPASCELQDALIEDGGLGIRVPPAGSAIAAAAAGSDEGEEFAIEVDLLGNVHLLDVGQGASATPDQTTADDGYGGACRDSDNSLYGTETDVKEWMYRWDTTPSAFSGVDTLVALKKAHDNLTNRHHDCDDQLARGDTEAEWSYAGGTQARGNFSGNDDCDGWFDRDNRNVLEFGPLGGRWLGLTCWWYYPAGGEISEADIRFDGARSWTLHPHDGDCSEDWDLESVATHEVGHSYGFQHASEHRGDDLTMSPKLEGTCEISERSLGLGDWLGMTSSY